MLLLRIVGILAVIAIGAGIVAYLLTGDRKYIGFSWRITRYSLAFALAVFVLLAAERLIVMV
jgi:hypothetical protein